MIKKILLIFVLLFLSGCSSISVNTNPLAGSEGYAVITQDYTTALAAGQTNSGIVWNKFGYNDDVDTATSPEIVSAQGGDKSFILNSAELLNISSTSILDANGTTGAHGVVITGVNENFEQIIDVVFLDGTNVVQSNLQFRGINRMALFRAGTLLQNQGDITAIASESNSVQAFIPQFSGTTEQAFLFIQSNHTFLAEYLFINVNKLAGGGTPKVTIIGWVRSYVSNAEYDIFELTIDSATTNVVQLSPDVPFVIGEKSILYFTASTDTNNALVNLRFSGLEKRND